MKTFRLIGCFLTLLAWPGFGQNEQPAQPPGSSGGRLTLKVVVNDKSGTPVTGLQQQDFTVEDNKQPRPIVSFQAMGNAAAGATTADAALRVVLVVDSVNTGFERVAFERDQIKKFLRQDAGKLAFPVAIDFFSDAGLEMQEAASRDGNAEAAYLDQRETALRTTRRSQGFYGAEDRTQLSLRAVTQLAEFEAKHPGRKLVIWVSPGWPLLSGPNIELTKKDTESIFNTIVSTSAQLRQADITLYSVDPLGTNDAGTFRAFYYEEFLKGVSSPKQAQLGNLALQVLAAQSGGRVLNSENDVAREIERCARDANAYYVITFDTAAADGPNEYHALEIRLDRPGLKPQARAGYYAQPSQSATH